MWSNTSPSVLKQTFSCRTIESSASSSEGMELSATSQVTLHLDDGLRGFSLLLPRSLLLLLPKNVCATLVLKVRGVGKEDGRAASPLRKTIVLCRRG
ncbi:hypothetical protein PsorP6_011567 [Peronosclerospora sorghi]|uniref:Uncharacterized protein n=1 Tax=Peronosclerospora sorghi TaxID=230839 RepID=A0ACC0WL99_9STRA|nr:hypothetical protein PsorP6_011567 [Peronosclerospora sorghi]